MTRQQVTEEEVREALPNGAFYDDTGSCQWTAFSSYDDPASLADDFEVLDPDQIAAAINERCGTCGGDRQVTTQLDEPLRPLPEIERMKPHEGIPDEILVVCPHCTDSSGNPTGSAHPELLELVRRG